MNLNQAITVLKTCEPVLGKFQVLLVFDNSSTRAVYQHGSRPFTDYTDLVKWCESLTAPQPPINPS